MTQRSVPVIVGPTCSGKTHLSLLLANRFDAEIISADSRQIYKYMNIGTAKPIPEELSKIKHHFIDLFPPDADYNAGLFGEQGRTVIAEIFSRGRLPIVVGGSGLYIRSLIDGLFDGPHTDPEYRDSLYKRVELEGVSPLL
ncbi:MAG TPA: isopentenyl transferase family protein, partial [Bacteroidota bacterium]|nr:isopentenyl transferase family protein [Bacteroidota bacterium]